MSDDPQVAWEAWKIEQTPDNLNKVVKAMDPMINWKLSSMGAIDNPQLKHQARLIIADSVKTYDPSSGAKVPSWARTQLQGLQRYRREVSSPVKVPERAQLDAWSIEKATRELEDKLGREPDVQELSAQVKMPIKRIQDVRKLTRPVAAAAQMYDDGNEAHMPDFDQDAMGYVHMESDYIDRKIIEKLTGFGGSPLMQKNEIAVALKISPSQVTRRSERIASKLRALSDEMQKTYT